MLRPVASFDRPGALDPGEIIHLDGRVLGTHQGIINYTIGQRKGLGISAPEPLFVIRLEPEQRRVIVGPHEALAKPSIWVREINWLSDPKLFEDWRWSFSDHESALPSDLPSLTQGVSHRCANYLFQAVPA